MALYTTEGIVLKTRNIGEADRIITFYSPERGKVRAVARGARRPRSRFVSSTQMFAYADFQVFSGKSLDSISQVQLKEAFPRLHDDLTRLAYASYVSELVDEMVEEGEKDERVFALLLSYIRVLVETADPEMATRGFELKFATLLGYRPRLDSCAECGRSDLGRESGFDPRVGGLICSECLARSPGTLRVSLATVELLKALLDMGLAKAERLKANPGSRREMERILRAHLDFRLGRKLRSLDFLMAVKAAPGIG